jgi:hypothetical protein
VRVSSEHVTALRAVLDGDEETFERLTGGVGEEHLTPLSVLLAMAFSSVARMRFSAGWSEADVIRFVAWMRVQYGNDFHAISPSLAEALLLTALQGVPLRDEFDDAATAYTQAALLRALTGDLSEQHMGIVFNHACQQADRWLQLADDNARDR